MSDDGGLHQVSEAIGALRAVTRELANGIARVERKIDEANRHAGAEIDALGSRVGTIETVRLAALEAKVGALGISRAKATAIFAGLAGVTGFAASYVWPWLQALAK